MVLCRSALAAILSLLACGLAVADEGALFREQVAPILQRSCVSCHGGDKPKGGLSLATRQSALAGGDSGAAIRPGKPDDSLLVEYIGGEKPQMPQGAKPLSAGEVALVRKWIAQGAVWPNGLVLRNARRADRTWWSLQPLMRVAVPSPTGIPEAWSTHPVDRFVYAELVKKGLRPSPPADKPTIIRRATFDLTGLPPTPEEIDAFVNDRSSDAYQRLIDRLLASSRYGERWGRHWLDVIRFGESSGYERNHLRDNAWPFRDYVIRSFNEDKPFDRLVLEHLAGDQLAAGDPETEVGTGFLVAGSYDDVGNEDPVAQAQIRANTLDDTITATGTAMLGLTVNCARCHDHKFDPIPQADYYRLQAAFAGVYQGTRVPASRTVKHEPSAKQSPAVKQAAMEAWIGHFEQPKQPTYLMKRGDPQQRGENIAPSSLSVLEGVEPGYQLPLDAPEGQRRLALARWIVHEKNPLTPRVLANRVWHYHFGRGIVGTPSDFGFNGERPTHPELLDWLAAEIHRQGWRLKPLHRLIMTSQTYRQASRYDAVPAGIDADAHYLWHFPPRRLEAEAVRDAMLAVAGKLELRAGGPGFRLYQYTVDNVAQYRPLDKFGRETYRRSVYHQNPRSFKVDLLGQFDCPDPSLPVPKREVTVSPLQALALLNHSFTTEMARSLAERLQRERSAGGSAGQVRRAFRLAFGREPDEAERDASVRLIGQQGLSFFCRALFNANEFIYVD